MRKLPKIWTALFLAWLSKICVATSPKILSNDTAPIKAIGSDWIIECVGERPVTWSYTIVHDRIPPINETTEYNPSSDYPHSAILNVSNITFRDVQSYKCHFEDEIDDENWSSPNCTFGNVTCAHLFVDDPTNLVVSVKDGPLWTMSSIVGSPLIIPCMPTSPFVSISISRNDEFVPNAVYSETEGFTINPGYARHHGYYTCKGERGNISNVYDIIVVMNEYIHENPKIDASLANAVKAGEDFTLNCTLETASKTKFHLQWVSPNSVLNTTRTKKSAGKFIIPGSKPERTVSWIAVTVQNATKEDDLSYICTLIMDSRNRKNVNYTVEVYDDGDEFLIVSTVKHDIYVNASSNAKWAIEMYGFPRVVTREWRDRNNTVIENKTRFRLEDKPKERSVILNIDEVEVDDAGTYYFFVENQHGKSTILKLNLTVRGVPSVTLTSLYSEGEFYNVDENVTFECVAKSYPNPDIEWSFSGCPEVSSTSLDSYNCPHLNILESTFANFDNDWGRGAVATIVARFKTSGNVTCDAINGLTDNYTSSHSKVKLIDFMDSSQTGFTIEGTDKPIERHKTVLVCVVAKASFTSKLEWIAMMDDSEETTNRLAVNATTNIEGIFLTTKLTETEWSYRNHLVIEDVSLKHNGTYTCTAENLSGNTEVRNFSLVVQKRMAPKLITNLNNSKILVTTGDFVPKLNCSASGTPHPTITWFLNDVPFSAWPQNFKNLRHSSTNPLGGSYLQIPSQLEYNGNYTCSATNSADTVAKFMIIEITDGSGTRYWIGGVVILSIVIFFLLMCLGYKSYKDRKYQIDLLRRRRDEFEKGDIQNINPELPVSDQVNLLPYYDTWEFPREKLKLDKQLGSGAFGRVVKAIAEGIVPNEPLTTVAVKMVKPNSDDSHLNALVSELKIMVHLGKHINVVNLLGACTKDFAKKKELFVIVEYCRYGSLLSYLHRHKNEFVDQINPDTGNLDRSILYTDTHIQSPPRLNYAAVTFTDSETTRIAPNGYRFLEEITSPLGEPEIHGSVSYNPNDDYVLNSNVQSVCTDMSFVSNSVMGTDGRRRSSSGSTSHGHYRGDYQCIDVSPITTTDLLIWSFQIARGMEYLSSRKVLHGDLAARNVLLSDSNVVKICDFGLAKEMYQERYNKKSEGVLLPVKWMAIESICFGVFSSLSDVWSYGVVLWELFTLGKTPYPGMEADQKFYNMLTDGYRMEKPALAPSSIYDLMSDCWNYDPTNRPNFTSIAEHLGDLMDESLKAHYVDLNDHYSRENRVNMEGREDYLLQMGGGDIVFKEPSPEPDRTYTNVVPEQSDSNYLQPNTSTAYENLDGGPVVQPLANNAGYIFMNHGQNEPKPDDIFSPRPVEVTSSHDSSFNFGEPISLHGTDKLHVDPDCTNDRTPGQGVGSNSNSRSPLEEVQGVSNINYVPNTICLPYTSNDFAENQRGSADSNCNHKNLDEYSSKKKRIKNDSGVSSLGSANDYKIPSNSVPNGDLNGHTPSAKDNLIYFQTDQLSPILVNGHDARDESYNLVHS